MTAMQKSWALSRSAVGLSVLLALGACGGGGGGSSAASSGGSTSVAGVAGTGAPMVGATVTVTCQSGAATATTDANGAFTATFASPPTAPCVIKAVAVDGSGGEVVHYALLDVVSASGSNKANINPATTVMVGEVANGDPERFFSGAAPLSNITPAAVSRAVAHVQELLDTSIDPLKGVYAADKVNELDRKFDQLKIEWDAGGVAVLVTSKVSGEVVGTVRPASYDADKTAYLQRLRDTAVVPSAPPSFTALDTQFGAGLTAALASANQTAAFTALDALIHGTYLDGGLSVEEVMGELWANARGAVFGKFNVLRCGTSPLDPASEISEKPVCRVSAPVTLANGTRDVFETRVIEVSPGQWRAWGDQRLYRLSVHPTAVKQVNATDASAGVAYLSGLQVWIPIPRGANPEPDAVPNANVVSAVVRYSGVTLASLSKSNNCPTATYLQVGGCGGNFMRVQPAQLQAMAANLADNRQLPVVQVSLYGASEVLLRTYSVTLTALPVSLADLADATKPYAGKFATLSAASLSAFSQAGTAPQTFNLSWTAGAPVDEISWLINSAGVGRDSGTVLVPLDAVSASFTSNVAYDPTLSYASFFLVSRAREGRKYWTQYLFTVDT